MSKTKKILGIDLGTTYSCVACINDYGQPEVIPNAEGERTTPSVVWFDGQRAVVGQEAKGMTSMYPNSVCSFVKRDMGNDNYAFDVDGVQYVPEHISSLILRKLAKDASQFLGEEIKDVVITCPAYFFIKEREATKRAGEIAGLNVLRIINEPTAAAFAYGVKPNENIEERFVLVYDLGGGTFDVTIVRISKDGVDVLCTDGDHQLGGKDWDDRLVQYLIKRFNDESRQHAKIENDPELYYDVLQKAEQCKKQLSDKKNTKTTLSYQGDKVQIETSREQFEQLTEDLLDRTITLTNNVLAVARQKGCTKFDQLILVGGSSRMPQVANKLRKKFSIEPQIFEPDEAVAKGAAIIGNNIFVQHLIDEKLKRRSSKLTVETASPEELEVASKQVADENNYTLEVVTNATKRAKNVSSKTFGITVLDGYDAKGQPLLSVSNLIYRNTPLPAERSEQYATIADKQQIVVVELVENMSDAPLPGQPEPVVNLDSTESLWNGELPVKPNLPKYSPIDVTFRIDENGRLTLIAYDPASNGKLEKTIPEQNADTQANMEKVTLLSRALIIE
ncbi:MAG: Hsp70 family protein [Planctomycetaceae bacterium]|jgi:molecular chaperone DnaK (HSP70)|nr:Hsp70 family protein [Planctomycetaceae bacterium]